MSRTSPALRTPPNTKEFYRGKNTLVAGGGGFIGSFLVARLVAQGARVTVLSRSPRRPRRLTSVSSHIRMAEADLCDKARLERVVRKIKPDLIFNAAAHNQTEHSRALLEPLIKANAFSALNLLEAGRAAGARLFIQLGSGLEYGAGALLLRESHRESPISPYGLSKLFATRLVLSPHHDSGIKTVVARLATIFGPTQNLGPLIPNLIHACLTAKDFAMNPGDQTRDFLFVEDAVDALCMLGESESLSGEIVNIGAGRGYKVKYIANTINALCHNPITIRFGAQPYRPFDPMRYVMDTGKARTLLDWSPRTHLKKALHTTVAWYKKNLTSLMESP